MPALATSGLTAKEEPESDQEPAPDPIPVPPGVVLDKLDSLVNFGRLLLRYSNTVDGGWGINGKLSGHWCSFRAESDGECRFEDEVAWSAEADGWADSETEWLERLRLQVQSVPTSAAPQPSALRPRECRRDSFTFHRAEHQRRRALAKAKGATAQSSAEVKVPIAKALGAKGSVARSPVAKALVAKTPLAKPPCSEAPANVAGIAKPPVVKVLGAKQPVGKSPMKAPAATAPFTKAPLGTSSVTKAFVVQPVTAKVALVKAFPEQLASAETPVAKALAKPPAVLAPATSATHAVDMETEVLAPLRGCGGDTATQLVRLVLGRRGASASLRIALLKYVRSHASLPGASRQLVLLRGPPGAGKSAWALDELRMRVGVTDGEDVARFAHICATDDFLTTFKDGELEFSYDPEQLELAHARNEARVKLAMDAGIEPVYVDNSHLRLWEMAGYVRLAQSAGYEVSVVSPDEICIDWRNVDALLAADGDRRRSLSREALEALLGSFEELPGEPQQLQAILGAERVGRAAPATVGTPAGVSTHAAEPDILATPPTTGAKRLAPSAPVGMPAAKAAKVLQPWPAGPRASQPGWQQQAGVHPAPQLGAVRPRAPAPNAPVVRPGTPTVRPARPVPAAVRPAAPAPAVRPTPAHVVPGDASTPESRVAASLLRSMIKR